LLGLPTSKPSPYHLRSLHLRNLVAIPLMCQYSAEIGKATDRTLSTLANWRFTPPA
jgi:hypothetical protein